ncbi:hypothetical protein [Streptomyces lydicus]|uniref:hypothetical protein n=1 Tax=Streptomyces lydicus TaxID=47763 RepID=UPI00379E2307
MAARPRCSAPSNSGDAYDFRHHVRGEHEMVGSAPQGQAGCVVPTKLRAAWDGATLRNTTKEEAQEVRDPAMVLHCHVTASDWAKYVGESEAAGGSYNRILPFLLGSVPMLDDDRVSLPKVDGSELSDAYGWATARPRVITLSEDARPLWRTVRRYARILGETLPERQAVFIERSEGEAAATQPRGQGPRPDRTARRSGHVVSGAPVRGRVGR